VSWDRTVVILRRLRGLLVVLMFLALPAVAQAVTTVTNTNDSGAGSLRAAIVAANGAPSPGGTIDFAPGLSGTITLTTGVLPITQSVTIAGPGAGTITIDGNDSTTVFDIAPSAADQNVTISGVTITNGSATTNGGGILTNNLSSLTLSGVTISGNHVSITDPAGSSGGGGVYVNGGTLEVDNSTITNNTVTLTGAGSGSSGGGGIYNNGGDITLSGSQVTGNTVHQTTSSGSSGGGGIYADSGEIDLTNSSVQGNAYTIDSTGGDSDGGGGIYDNGSSVSLGNSHVDANTFMLADSTDGQSGGGGVYSNGGDVTAVSSSIDSNTADLTDHSTSGSDGGGGVYSNGGGIGTVFASISKNTATIVADGDDNGGGAVFDDGSGDIFFTSTLSDNTGMLSGSGRLNNGGGAVHSFGGGVISDSTVAGNTINAPGGGLLLENSVQSFSLTNTIIADNNQTSAGSCAGTGTFSSGGFNLESTNTCGLSNTGDLVNTEPQLGPLQNNGGLTLTQALPASSPAVDAGTCTDGFGESLSVDQRGMARPQPAGGKCDIGAFELAPTAPPAPAPPAAVPGPLTPTSSTAASFSASVNPNGQATTVSFQYGIDSRYRPGGGAAVIYDQSTPPQTLPADSAAHAVSASAAGLVPNAIYHVRLVATNATGTTFGPDQTFTTPAGPAPPPPVLGQKVNAKPVSGQVFILVGTKLVPLTQAQQIPSGAILDTRAGSLQLTAAGTKGRKPETGVFGGAVFKLTQARNGLTNLGLAEGAFQGAPTYATCKAHKAGEASAAATKTLQLLHASAKGKFRTTGRYSAATVRGTKWTIADRCDGTLTRDIVHSVAVTDFVRHRTIVLHAGQSYLASAHAARRHK
jgi:hypothetical protein